MAWNYMSKDKWDLRFRLGANRYKISLQASVYTYESLYRISIVCTVCGACSKNALEYIK